MSGRLFYSVISVVFSGPVTEFKHTIQGLARMSLRCAERVCGIVVLRRSVHIGNISELRSLREENEKMREQVKLLTAESSFATAQLMQLRVYQSEEHKRTGFMVSAFITEETIATLKRSTFLQENFKRRVADTLVERAMAGIYHLTRLGKMTAMVFEPPRGPGRGQRDQVVSAVFETAKNQTKLIDVTARDGKLLT